MNSSSRPNRDNRNQQHHRNPRDDRNSSSARSSSRAPYDPREGSYHHKHARESSQVARRESKCNHICSRRGVMLICAVLTNGLVLICVVAAQMVTSGLSSAASMGGFDINSNFNLEGTDLQKARDLDMQYSQMRAPGTYGGVTFSLTFGVISLLFVVSGNKPPQLMSQKLLLGALVFQAVGAVGYLVAVALYLHFIIGVNSSDTCKQRQSVYARGGYTWMTCDVSGADAAVALFGIITAILYTAGAVFTYQTIRQVKAYLQHRDREAERRLDREPQERTRPQDRDRPQERAKAPRADAIFV